MTLDDRARKAAAAIHEAVRDVSPERVPSRSRVRPMLRYAPSFAVIALIVAGALFLRSLPNRDRFAGPLGSRLAQIRIGTINDELRAMKYSDGALWVLNTSRGQLSRIETRTNRVVARIAVGNDPTSLAIGFGSVWVSSRAEGSLTRIDVRSNSPSNIDIGGPSVGVATGEGAVWVATLSREILRLDPSTRAITRRFSLPKGFQPYSLDAGGGYVWVGTAGDGGIQRIDPRTGASTNVRMLGDVTLEVSGDGKALWVSVLLDGTHTIQRFDTATLDFENLSGVRGDILAVFGGEVWALSEVGDDLVRIDPETGIVRERIRAPVSVFGAAIGANSLWVSTLFGTVERISLG